MGESKNSNEPILVVVSGPSGVGKDSVIQNLKESIINCHFTITATTRDRRPSEIDGKDYIFLNKVAFSKKVHLDQFLEYAEVYGNLYGIPTKQVTDALSHGKDVIIKADVQGASTIKNKVEGSILIFLKPPSTADLEKRLRKRHTEDDAQLDLRLATAKDELSKIDIFDYVVVNDNIIDASEQIKHIINTQKSSQHRTKIKIF